MQDHSRSPNTEQVAILIIETIKNKKDLSTTELLILSLNIGEFICKLNVFCNSFPIHHFLLSFSGMIIGNDQTEILQKQSYWPSYNIASVSYFK